METPVLVFIGFMGAGKTTGARAAAAALGVRAIDTDRELEQRIGTSIEAPRRCSSARSVSIAFTPSAAAAARAPVVFPAPMNPMKTRAGVSIRCAHSTR